MAKTIWYISKYVMPTYAARVGSRGFQILREFVKMGHQAVMITSDSHHQADPPQFDGRHFHEDVDGVNVHWLKTRKYNGARSIGRILSWLDFEWQLWRMPKKSLPRPDIVIVSSLSLLTVINGLWLKWRYGCKFVLEIRDIWPLVLIETAGMSRYNPIVVALGFIEWLGYQFADLVVGTMPNLKSRVVEVTNRKCDVICIPQGIDPALLDGSAPVREDYIQSYFPQNKFIVCYAGSIGANNALEHMVSCARAMQYNNDGVHFVIVGEGYLKEQLMQQTKDLDNITFAPRVPKNAVQSLLKAADIVYFSVPKSRLFNYGQSLNKMIDYMLCGKPIVASYSGYPSMLNEANCGSFVPAGDSVALANEIERFANMPAEELSEIGNRGREWILANRKFEKIARDYLVHLNIEPLSFEDAIKADEEQAQGHVKCMKVNEFDHDQ